MFVNTGFMENMDVGDDMRRGNITEGQEEF